MSRQAADCPLSEPGQIDEWELLAQVAEGDDVAFTRLVDHHQDRLLRLCHRLLGDRAAAQDAAQEVFLKLYQKAGSFERRGQLYTLLYRVATNHCLNQIRRRKIVEFLPMMFGGGNRSGGGEVFEIEPEDEGPGPERQLQAARDWQATHRRIARLPPGQRVVLVLVRLEGLSYKEAAEALGISVGAVESRLVRAMKALLEDQSSSS